MTESTNQICPGCGFDFSKSPCPFDRGITCPKCSRRFDTDFEESDDDSIDWWLMAEWSETKKRLVSLVMLGGMVK